MVSHIRDLESCLTETMPETKWRVCRTFNNFTNSSSVYIRLKKHRKKFFIALIYYMTLSKLNLTRYYGFLMTFPTIDRSFKQRPSFPIYLACGRKKEKVYFPPTAHRPILEVRFLSQCGAKFSLAEDLHFSKTVMVS